LKALLAQTHGDLLKKTIHGKYIARDFLTLLKPCANL